MGLDSIAVAGVTQTVTARTAILDSGTTAILVGADDAAAIHAVRPQSLASAAQYGLSIAHAAATARRAVQTRMSSFDGCGCNVRSA